MVCCYQEINVVFKELMPLPQSFVGHSLQSGLTHFRIAHQADEVADEVGNELEQAMQHFSAAWQVYLLA